MEEYEPSETPYVQQFLASHRLFSPNQDSKNMVVLIDDILRDVFCHIGTTFSYSNDDDSEKESSKGAENILANFMLSGQEPLKVAFKFFESVTSVIVYREFIELINEKDERAKFPDTDIITIPAVMKVLQKSVTKMRCKSFDEEHLPFWDAMKSNVKELELGDYSFENPKYAKVIENMTALEKVTIDLDIYCMGFMEGLSLTSKEMVWVGEAFDQIENGEDFKIKFPTVKKLTVIGRYVGWGITDLSLESLVKVLKTICPALEELHLTIDDDNIDSEVPQTFIDLISKPNIDENLHVHVAFNFTLMESSWQKSNFHKELQKHPDIKLTGTKDGSESTVKIGEKKQIEFNLTSEMSEADDENGDAGGENTYKQDKSEEADNEKDEANKEYESEPAAKKKKA